MLSELRPLYGNYMNMNKSKLSSSGLELTLKYNLINKSDFSYTVSFNSSWLIENTIRSLSILKNGTLYKFDNLEIGNMGLPYQYLIPMIRLETGRPVGQIFTRVFKEIDATGTMIFVDANNDGFSDREDVGNGIPKLNLGFGNSISYKNWDLNFFFRGVFGHDLVNSFRSQYEVPYMISSYNLPATATDMRAQNGKLMVETSGILSSKDVENASFVSLDNICL
jgi:iron complex outermembrane receptor protein